MWNTTLCTNITAVAPVSLTRQLEILKEVGFDGFFVVWSQDLNMQELADKAKELGLIFQSLHAPWGKCRAMWREDETAAQAAVDELKLCIDACADHNIPILVVHVIIGFAEPPATPAGLPRFQQVIDYALEKGVKLGFENTEGEDYLQMILEHFKDYANVGFCWDTGHEMCYNHSQDLLALYGHQLICTHLNDNLGIKDPSGQISVADDLHLLPFDGIADWEDIAKRLLTHGFTGPLTFEVKQVDKRAGQYHYFYGQLPYEAYLAEHYKRACRFAVLLQKLGRSAGNP